MNALVTGGLGFLGRSLCAELIVQGHRVTILDNLSNAIAAFLVPPEPGHTSALCPATIAIHDDRNVSGNPTLRF